MENNKEIFLTIASHQLRTPLTGVKWALKYLLDDKNMSDENRKIIRTSIEKVNTAIDIIGEMLKDKSLETMDVNVKELITKIVEDLSYFIKAKEVSLKINDQGIDNTKVKANPETLLFALSNIIDNAIRYSPKGKVLINLENDNNFVKISVKDNGVGISEVDQQFIFGKFYRAKNAILIDPNSTGVGLYSTKRVVESYNGTINLESKIGSGTTVIIKLPIK
jgi:signal transduction histidine kinase